MSSNNLKIKDLWPQCNLEIEPSKNKTKKKSLVIISKLNKILKSDPRKIKPNAKPITYFLFL